MFRGCSTGPRQGQRLEFKRVRQTGNRAGGTSASKAGAHRPLLCAGSGAAVAARRYWRPWWTASASPGPATGRPTGSRWAKRKGEAGWTAITKRMAPPASWCSSIPSAATSSSGSARPSRHASLKPRPTPIGLDKAPGGGKQLPRISHEGLYLGELDTVAWALPEYALGNILHEPILDIFATARDKGGWFERYYRFTFGRLISLARRGGLTAIDFPPPDAWRRMPLPALTVPLMQQI